MWRAGVVVLLALVLQVPVLSVLLALVLQVLVLSVLLALVLQVLVLRCCWYWHCRRWCCRIWCRYNCHLLLPWSLSLLISSKLIPLNRSERDITILSMLNQHRFCMWVAFTIQIGTIC